MESVRSDDFAGLLAALGKPPSTASPTPTSLNNVNNNLPHQFIHPQQYVWQPIQGLSNPTTYFNNQPPQYVQYQPPQMPAPQLTQVQQQLPSFQQQLPIVQQQLPVHEKASLLSNPWIIALIVVAVVVILVLIWIQFTKMNTLPEDDDEVKVNANVSFRESERNDTHEIPPPSSLQPEDEDMSEFVASNLLKYVNEFSSKEVVDISGQDIPLQYGPPSPTVVRHQPSKRIVADESEEVDAYAKKRAALFLNSNDEGRV